MVKYDMIVYGKRIFYFILENHLDIVKEILLSKKLNDKEFKKLKKFNKKIILIDNKKAQSLAKNGNHQGYFLDIEFEPKEIDLKNSNFILVLDNITDMGNIGAIIRTAYALGADGVIIGGIKELKLSQVVRMSAGAAIDMPLMVNNNTLDIINILKTNNFLIAGADMNGVHSISTSSKIALIMGSEGEGLSNRIKQKLDTIISIEMKREFDSLNVSVAAGILMDRILNG